MTDLTIPLTALALGTAGLAAFDLQRREMRDVLGAVGFFVLGLVLGTVAQLLFPGGFLVGAVGGAALGATRLKEIRETRRRLLEEELEATNVRAERMVFLLDRQDRLRPVAGSIARGLGIVAGAFLTLLAGGLTLGGLVYQSGPLLFLGSIATVFPLAAWASYSVRFQEADLVNRHLMKCEDEVAGLPAAGPSGSTARGTEGSS